MKKQFSIILLSFFSLTSFANDVSKNFQSTAKINNYCYLSATNVNFGVYSPEHDSQASAAITIKCNSGTTSVIAIDGGNWTSGQSDIHFSFKEVSGSHWHRNLPNVAKNSNLYYGLFQDANMTIPWGGNGTLVLTPTARPQVIHDGTEKVFPIFGGLGSKQYVRSGNYLETLTVQVSY